MTDSHFSSEKKLYSELIFSSGPDLVVDVEKGLDSKQSLNLPRTNMSDQDTENILRKTYL